VGPEVALVVGAGTAASQGVGLAGKASANNVNWFEAVAKSIVTAFSSPT
jgi:hypothetical protein